MAGQLTSDQLERITGVGLGSFGKWSKLFETKSKKKTHKKTQGNGFMTGKGSTESPVAWTPPAGSGQGLKGPLTSDVVGYPSSLILEKISSKPEVVKTPQKATPAEKPAPVEKPARVEKTSPKKASLEVAKGPAKGTSIPVEKSLDALTRRISDLENRLKTPSKVLNSAKAADQNINVPRPGRRENEKRNLFQEFVQTVTPGKSLANVTSDDMVGYLLSADGSPWQGFNFNSRRAEDLVARNELKRDAIKMSWHAHDLARQERRERAQDLMVRMNNIKPRPSTDSRLSDKEIDSIVSSQADMFGGYYGLDSKGKFHKFSYGAPVDEDPAAHADAGGGNVDWYKIGMPDQAKIARGIAEKRGYLDKDGNLTPEREAEIAKEMEASGGKTQAYLWGVRQDQIGQMESRIQDRKNADRISAFNKENLESAARGERLGLTGHEPADDPVRRFGWDKTWSDQAIRDRANTPVDLGFGSQGSQGSLLKGSAPSSQTISLSKPLVQSSPVQSSPVQPSPVQPSPVQPSSKVESGNGGLPRENSSFFKALDRAGPFTKSTNGRGVTNSEGLPRENSFFFKALDRVGALPRSSYSRGLSMPSISDVPSVGSIRNAPPVRVSSAYPVVGAGGLTWNSGRTGRFGDVGARDHERRVGLTWNSGRTGRFGSSPDDSRLSEMSVLMDRGLSRMPSIVRSRINERGVTGFNPRTIPNSVSLFRNFRGDLRNNSYWR